MKVFLLRQGFWHGYRPTDRLQHHRGLLDRLPRLRNLDMGFAAVVSGVAEVGQPGKRGPYFRRPSSCLHEVAMDGPLDSRVLSIRLAFKREQSGNRMEGRIIGTGGRGVRIFSDQGLRSPQRTLSTTPLILDFRTQGTQSRTPSRLASR